MQDCHHLCCHTTDRSTRSPAPAPRAAPQPTPRPCGPPPRPLAPAAAAAAAEASALAERAQPLAPVHRLLLAATHRRAAPPQQGAPAPPTMHGQHVSCVSARDTPKQANSQQAQQKKLPEQKGLLEPKHATASACQPQLPKNNGHIHAWQQMLDQQDITKAAAGQRRRASAQTMCQPRGALACAPGDAVTSVAWPASAAAACPTEGAPAGPGEGCVGTCGMPGTKGPGQTAASSRHSGNGATYASPVCEADRCGVCAIRLALLLPG